MKQRAQITLETEETIVVRNSGAFSSGFCPLCRRNVHMFPPEVLAPMTGSSERQIFRLLEAGKIHFVEAQRIYACPRCYEKVLASRSAASGPAAIRTVGEIDAIKETRNEE